MEKKGAYTSKTTSKGGETSVQGATGANSGASLGGNDGLRAKYDEMHAQGPSAWFDDGRLEREMILRMGEPWKGLNVLEIGCGEGRLAIEVDKLNGNDGAVLAVDFSGQAIKKAKALHNDETDTLAFFQGGYRDLKDFALGCDVIVMQGVLEHLDDPFKELQWMIEHFHPKTVITTSPGFLNPRGIVWMTLHMLGAVMSKTDLHFLHPWQFEEFCQERGYRLTMQSRDTDWGFGEKMFLDLRKRIPLALKDGNIPFDEDKLEAFLAWLRQCGDYLWKGISTQGCGAVICYRIDL